MKKVDVSAQKSRGRPLPRQCGVACGEQVLGWYFLSSSPLL